MDFGALFQMLNQAGAPAGLGAHSMGGMGAAMAGQGGGAQSLMGTLGKSMMSGARGDPGFQQIPQGQQHRSQFMASFLPQLLASIGQRNHLGRLGEMV